MKKLTCYIYISLFLFFIMLPDIVHAAEAPPAPNLDLCFFYSQLTEKEKNVYQQTMEEALLTETSFVPCEELSTDSIIRIVHAVVQDQPQLFWIEESFQYTYKNRFFSDTNVVTEITLNYNDLAYNLDENIALFSSQTSAIINDLYGLSPLDQERLVHDRLINMVSYQNESSHNQTAFSALCLGESVCAGYTRAFQYLMNLLGVPCIYCKGTSNDSKTNSWDSHAWNLIKLGDSYYNVDVTWDDTTLETQGMICYSYYNLPDSELNEDHKRSDDSLFLPACESTEYSFENLYQIPAPLGCLVQAGYDLSRIPVVYSIDDFYYWMREFMLSTGTGSYTFYFIAYGEECSRQIIDQVDFTEGYLTDVVAGLGMNGYQYNFSDNSISLTKGYYFITMDISLY